MFSANDNQLRVDHELRLHGQAEVELSQTIEQLKIILQSIHDGILVQDLSYKCIYANDAGARMCGFADSSAFLSASVDEVIKRFRILTETDEPLRLDQLTACRVFAGEEIAEATYKLISNDSVFWTTSTSRPMRDSLGQVKYAVTVFRDVTKEKRAELEAKTLNEITTLFASSLEYKETIASLARLLVPKFADWFGLEVANENGVLETIYAAHADPQKTQLALEMRRKYPSDPDGNAPTYQAFRTGQPVLIEDIPNEVYRGAAVNDEHFSMLTKLNLKSCAILPIRARDKVIGLLNLCHSESGRRLTQQDMKLLTEIATRAGFALENARLYEKTRTSEERLELALRGSGIGLWEWMVDRDRLYLSDRCFEIFGAIPQNFKGNFHDDFQRFIHSDDRSQVNAAVSESVRERKDYAVEYRVIRENDGSTGWVQANGRTYYDHAGNPIRMVGTVIDITKRKEFEDLLRLRSRVLESMSEGVSLADENGRIVYTNPAEDKLFGYEPGELIGKHVNIQNAYDKDENAKKVSLVLDELKRVGQWSGEWHNKRKDGTTFYTRAQISALDISGRPHWVCVQEDITLEKNTMESLEKAKVQAERANQAKSIFLANMSHEIRTPMNAILGFSKLLNESTLSSAEREDYCRRIQKNGDQLLHLIDDILDFSRVEAGQLRVHPGECDLKSLANDIHRTLDLLVKEKGIATSLEIDPKLPNAVMIDEIRLRQVLMNLVNNAAKFTDNGHICLRFRGHEDSFLVDVEDTGIGIPIYFQPFLFRPFSQADSSNTRRFGGSGLGLVLSKRICDALGGSLDLVRSAPNHGTIFRIRLPLRPAVSTADNLTSRPSSGSENRLPNGLRILLAEDSADNQALIRTYLKNYNVHLSIVQNGQEALELARSLKPDVLLMDIQMPILDGLEATRRLRRDGVRIPIIALTAHALPEEIERSLQSGCNLHLTKPVSRDELVQAISKFVKAEAPCIR